MDLPFREEVFTGTWVDVELVNNLLVVEGILTVVANAKLSTYLNRIRALYVLDPDRVERAREIVARVSEGQTLQDPKAYRSWRCRGCNELIEGQFVVCWNCGRPHAG